MNWKLYKEELPPNGEEVLAFHSDWIDEDFNPKGTRIGFRTEDDFISDYWWDYQDTYMTICHTICDDNDAYGENTRNSIGVI